MSELIAKNDMNEMRIEPTMTADENTAKADTKSGEIDLPLADIYRDENFLGREKRNEATVEDYAEIFIEYLEAMKNNEKVKYPFPPITVRHDEAGRYILLAGDHRSAAALKAGFTTIRAKIFHGSADEAFVFAMKDNATNALPLSKGDKRYIIIKALMRFNGRKSPRAVAKEIGCSPSYASEINVELCEKGLLEMAAKREGADGKMYPAKQKRAVRQRSTDCSEQVESLPTEPDTGSEMVQSALDFTPDGVIIPPPVGENKVPEKSAAERIDEFMASLDVFVHSLQYGDLCNFCRKLVDWLRRRAEGKRLLKSSVSKHDFPVGTPTESSKTIIP